MFTHTKTPSLIDLPSQITNNQRWYTLPDGTKLPSITTVLGQKEKPALQNWRQSLGPAKADKETKRCSDRGTAVHLMAERYLNNEEDCTRDQIQEHIRLFNQLKLKLGEITNIRAQEVALYSEQLKVAGRTDCIAEFEGILSIIDFKTATNNKDLELVQDYFLQATAYAIMFHERTEIPIEDIVIIIAVEKGLMPLVFKDKIDNYVKPLLERINTFYRK